jgi:alpha-L-rhamnosidase
MGVGWAFKQRRWLALPLCLALLQPFATHAQEAGIEEVREGFAHPPDIARVMMRWWWFGPSVTQPELKRELEAMKAGGIGGAEIQPSYPLELDDSDSEFHNFAFLSPEHLDAIGFASEASRSLGLRLSVTLGSGWPFGGSTTPVTEAAGRLRVVTVVAPESGASLPVASIRNGEKLLAAFVAPGTPDKYQAEHAQLVSEIRDQRLTIPAGVAGPHVALFFIASRTGQQVKRPAVGAEGFVLDHLNREAVDHYLQSIAEPLARAFGDHPPDSVFSDSLEVYDCDWTPDFLDQFRTRRGYDLKPRLPELVAGVGADAEDLRYDWGRTLAELVEQNYLFPISAWAQAHHTAFRSQTYGFPAVTLASNRLADVVEGEGFFWHDFSLMRWASSASHLYGRSVTSAEAWTWLHSPAFRATPLDLKAVADTYFIQGINQLVGHGWPYSPPSVAEPGWAFYAAGVFNDHNPWWIVMPDLMSYLQRVSYLMRAGKPANDVAILLPTADVQAHFSPGHVSVSDAVRTRLGGNLIPQILDSGYGFDFIDSESIERVGISYPVLVMPAMERLSLNTYKKIQEYVRRGGIVIATQILPSRAPGVLESVRDSVAVQRISEQLFAPRSRHATLIAAYDQLGQTLRRLLQPDVSFEPLTPQIGFIHRSLAKSDIYFIANTDNQPHTIRATFRSAKTHAQWWDPFTAKSSDAGRSHTLALALAPYESRVLVFSGEAAKKTRQATQSVELMDLSRDWKVTFDRSGQSGRWPSLHSWSDAAATRFYSGTVAYERTINISASLLRSEAVLLDFGVGVPVEPATGSRFISRAWLEAPVREAAVVYVNGTRAGSVWHPPYTLDLRPLLHTGNNELKIVVANTAINELAGKARPDYSLLNLRYGERFTPQGMNQLEPLPSGILGPLRLSGDSP